MTVLVSDYVLLLYLHQLKMGCCTFYLPFKALSLNRSLSQRGTPRTGRQLRARITCAHLCRDARLWRSIWREATQTRGRTWKLHSEQHVAPGSFFLDLTTAQLCTVVEKARTGLLITVDNLREQKCKIMFFSIDFIYLFILVLLFFFFS